MTTKDPQAWLADSADSLASSHAPRMTGQLQKRVLAVQVKMDYTEVPRVTAYWSADGQIGLAEDAHDPQRDKHTRS